MEGFSLAERRVPQGQATEDEELRTNIVDLFCVFTGGQLTHPSPLNPKP